MQLPTDLSPQVFDERFRLEFASWKPAVEEVCGAAGISFAQVVPFLDGSNLVARVGDDWVVKIFPPFHRDQWESERRVLPGIHAASPLPTPELIAEGEREDGYTYVVMTHLRGRNMEGAWEALSPLERRGIMASIGELMAAVHASPVGGLADLPPSFDELLTARVSSVRAHHERKGTPQWIVERLDAFVPSALGALDLHTPPVLLTGEYTPFNLLLTEGPSPVRLAAMLDFGDCMIGPAVYDLLGPIVFLGGGDPELLQALFEGHGLMAWPPAPTLRMGLLALLFVHRYSNPPFQFRVAGWQETGSLEALADCLFGTG